MVDYSRLSDGSYDTEVELVSTMLEVAAKAISDTLGASAVNHENVIPVACALIQCRGQTLIERGAV